MYQGPLCVMQCLFWADQVGPSSVVQHVDDVFVAVHALVPGGAVLRVHLVQVLVGGLDDRD